MSDIPPIIPRDENDTPPIPRDEILILGKEEERKEEGKEEEKDNNEEREEEGKDDEDEDEDEEEREDEEREDEEREDEEEREDDKQKDDEEGEKEENEEEREKEIQEEEERERERQEQEVEREKEKQIFASVTIQSLYRGYIARVTFKPIWNARYISRARISTNSRLTRVTRARGPGRRRPPSRGHHKKIVSKKIEENDDSQVNGRMVITGGGPALLAFDPTKVILRKRSHSITQLSPRIPSTSQTRKFSGLARTAPARTPQIKPFRGSLSTATKTTTTITTTTKRETITPPVRAPPSSPPPVLPPRSDTTQYPSAIPSYLSHKTKEENQRKLSLPQIGEGVSIITPPPRNSSLPPLPTRDFDADTMNNATTTNTLVDDSVFDTTTSLPPIPQRDYSKKKKNKKKNKKKKKDALPPLPTRDYSAHIKRTRRRSMHFGLLGKSTLLKDSREENDPLASIKSPRFLPTEDTSAKACLRCSAALKKRTIRNCKGCGNAFCKKCVAKKIRLPHLGYGKKKVEVCASCYDAFYLA